MELYPDFQNWTEQRKQEFFAENSMFIWHLVSRFSNILRDPACSFEDLIQEASITFFIAMDRYDITRGTPFGSFAKQMINNTLNQIYRSSRSNKRITAIHTTPFESNTDENGQEYMGADNMDIARTITDYNVSVEDNVVKKDEVARAIRLVQRNFPPEATHIFVSLSLKLRTQVELAAELDCSQAKISLTYNKIKKFLRNVLSQEGDDYGDEIFPR